MAKSRLKLDESGRELGARGTWALPVAGGGCCRLSGYEGNRFECHFHPEIEVTLVEKGEMYYRANDKVFHLRAGDGIFVNVEVMHAGWQVRSGQDCCYVPLNFSPVMVSGHEGSLIGTQYVEPLLREGCLPYLVFLAERPEDADALSLLREFATLMRERPQGFELLVGSVLARFWLILYKSAATGRENAFAKNAEGIKKAIRHIEENYADHLTLDALARTAALSRSEFCRSFHRFTGRTPFEYLQHHRVLRALPLLREGRLSVTEIASLTGFSGPSYFAEIFRRFMGVSPLAYRRARTAE